MPTIEERVASLEKSVYGWANKPELIELADDAEPLIENLRTLPGLDLFDIIPWDVAVNIDVRPGVLEAQRVGVAFLSEPGRESLDLTEGEYWWCIQRGYAVLAGLEENQDHVGVDPPGLSPALLESQWLRWLQQGAFYWAKYCGQVGQPKVAVPTGDIDWSSLPYSTAGGSK